ncbi:MAG: hypothetical protein JXR10_11765 [Cyclobacteriaceae bacterium]
MKRIFGVLLLFSLAFTAISQDKVKPTQPDFPGDLMIDFGFNFVNQQPDKLPNHLWGSNSFGIYYNHRARINDYISFHPSIGFTFDKYSFDDQFTWMNNGGGFPVLDSLDSGSPLVKNKLVVNYLELPLEFRIHPFSTVKGEGFFIGLGGVAGFRMGAHTKVKYFLGENSIKEKLYDDFNVQRFRYGLQARFGFKTCHFFYKMYVNDMFSSSPDASGKNPKTFTIGINFSGF